jgi:acyl carrier protein
MPESVRDRVLALLQSAKNVAPEDVGPDTTFQDLGLDSLDAFNLIADLEDEFGIELPNEEVMGIRSIGSAIAAVEKLVAERNPA